MHSANPILSIILPVYNCEKYVRQAIESIQNQTFNDFELLIADDASSDSSKMIIADCAMHDKRIRAYHNPVNQGKVRTSNRLFELCAGKFVTVHDADDFSDNTRFAKQIQRLQKDNSLVMCGTSFKIITAHGALFREVFMPDNFTEILKNIHYASQFHGPTMVIRKAAITNGLYRQFFNEYNEDCDLAFRMIEKGPCTNLPDILYTYRIRPNSLSKTITPEKKNLYKMAVEFHDQRTSFGSDDLMDGNNDEADRKLSYFMMPYKKDPALIHRENAAFLMYYKLNKQAIFNAWKACMLKPLNFNNWRTLQYCIRKSWAGI